jgi:uncharacterized protein YbaR (Trm112 family)
MPDSAEPEPAVPEWLFPLIRCPISRGRLRPAGAELIAWLQQQQTQGVLTTRIGRSVSEIPTQGLVSEDGSWFYAIHRGIPTLIPDDAVKLPENSPILG